MLKKYKGPMVILLIIQFLVMVGFGIVIPILPFFVQKLGGGALSLGIFMWRRDYRTKTNHQCCDIHH